MTDNLYRSMEKAYPGKNTEMPAEFAIKIKEIVKNPKIEQKLAQIISEAGNEFPCLSCPSKDECGSFKWFLKWFGRPK